MKKKLIEYGDQHVHSINFIVTSLIGGCRNAKALHVIAN